MRRPSGIISDTISSRSSSLLLLSTSRAEGSFTRRGSQQTWRSFSSASSTTMRLCARLRSATCSRTRSCSVARMASYSSRWSGARVMRRRMVCLGGSSVATSDLVRRRMNGLMRRTSCMRRVSSRRFSMGVRNRLVKPWRSPSSPGMRNANCDHSSSRLFSIGVPDRHRRWRLSSMQTARVALAAGLLIACASSSTTTCQGSAFISTTSRASSV